MLSKDVLLGNFLRWIQIWPKNLSSTRKFQDISRFLVGFVVSASQYIRIVGSTVYFFLWACVIFLIFSREKCLYTTIYNLSTYITILKLNREKEWRRRDSSLTGATRPWLSCSAVNINGPEIFRNPPAPSLSHRVILRSLTNFARGVLNGKKQSHFNDSGS